jgi:hypothetical protein
VVTRRPIKRQNRGRAAASGRAPFTPLSITSATVVGWWRSDRGIITGTGVAAWENQANVGGGTQWAQGTGANQPAYTASDPVFNNRPSLLWDGINDSMGSAIPAPAPGTTNRFYWIVADNISFPIGSGTLISGIGGTAHIIYRSGIDVFNQLSVYNSVESQGPSTFTVGAARLVQAGLTNSVADFIKIGSSSGPGGVNAGNGSAASMILGAFTAGGGFANVKIAEVLITNGIPNASERAALEAYAVGLYGAGVTT